MALVKGTNCGFVTVAPVTDPTASNTMQDTVAQAFKDVAPVGAVKVIEIGWWCDNATEEANFEAAIYDHNIGDDEPENVVGWDQTNAKGTTAGWKKVTGLNIPITAGTTYWIGIQLDNTSSTTYTNYTSNGQRRAYKSLQTSLTNPWGITDYFYDSYVAFYAVVEIEEVGTNMKINISDVFKDISEIKINIGGVWKDVTAIKINRGDVWKDVYG